MSDTPRSKPGCLSIFLFIALILSALLNLILMVSVAATASGDVIVTNTNLPRFSEKLVHGVSHVDPTKSAKIALVRLHGIINSETEGAVGDSMVDDIAIAMRQASEDNDVKAIIVSINSPGGEVTASDEIYHSIKKAREKKPGVIWMGSIAASGGYYAACGGTQILANETTFTGSIGVIISSINYESLLGKVGVSPVVFKSGKFKDILSGSRPMTPEEESMIQGMVMQTYDKFVGIVATERKLEEGGLRQNVADGRILSGKDALQAGLIDGVGHFEDAIAKARELGKAPDAPVFQYEAAFKLAGFLRSLSQAASAPAKIQVELSPSFGAEIKPGRLYYLPATTGGM